MKHHLPLAAATLALIATSLPAAATADITLSDVSTSIGDQVAARSAPSSGRTRTRFGLSAVGYGSRVRGGDVPTGSDSTAFRSLTCTNVTGKVKRNYEARVEAPGLGVLEGVTTRVWTDQSGGKVSSNSTNSIAKVTVADSPLGSVILRGVESRSQAFNKNGRFGTKTRSSVATIIFRPASGPAQELDVPTPGRPVVVPGLLRIAVGNSAEKTVRTGATAAANALDITTIPTSTRVRVAQSRAEITNGIKRGLFSGYAAGVRSSAADDNLRKGRTILVPMPCQGTDGEAIVKQASGTTIGGLLDARGLASGVRAVNRTKVAKGSARGSVARASLVDGQVQVNGIVAKVNVRRTSKGLKRNANGSSVLEVIANGETYSLPDLGELEIPGVVKLEAGVRERIRNGLRVIGVRATVLDGTGAIVDLGIAQVAIRRGAKK